MPKKRSKKTKAVSRRPKALVPIQKLKLPVQLEGVLVAHGIDTANELETYSKASLMKLPNIGVKSVDWIKKRLKEQGFGFGVVGARRKTAAALLHAEDAATAMAPLQATASATPPDPRLTQPPEMKTRMVEVELEPKDYNWLIWRAKTWGVTVPHVLKKMVRTFRAADHTRAGQSPGSAEEGGTVPERDYREGHREGVRGSQGIVDDL